MSVSTCAKCLQHYYSQPFIVEACASVGIEHGKSTQEMIASYLKEFHKRKHKEP